MAADGRQPTRVALLGYFGSSNLGNEAALQAMLFHLRHFFPQTEITCIGIDSRRAAAMYQIRSIPLAETPFRSWRPRSSAGKAARKLCRISVGLALEPYSWAKGFLALRQTQALIMPGGGLLTDGQGLFRGGPYDVLKWTLIAKACRCKVAFLSVGAGPLHGALGRRLVKLALSFADVRSYRDETTKRYLERVGFQANGDPVYPDLVFSLPERVVPEHRANGVAKRIVGLGPMESLGERGGRGTTEERYQAYLESLVALAGWLIGHGYGVRMLVGDWANDQPAKQKFAELLRQRSPGAEKHVVDDPISSVGELLSQLADTDLVVASRFHGVLLSLLCGTPAVCISFDNKLDALMGTMGMGEYCLDGNSLEAAQLIQTFRKLEEGAGSLQPLIRQRAATLRSALDEQYERLFADLAS